MRKIDKLNGTTSNEMRKIDKLNCTTINEMRQRDKNLQRKFAGLLHTSQKAFPFF